MFTVSCPNCSATYQLDETKVGPQGRKLKCARCNHIWVATPPATAPVVAETEMPEVTAPEPAPAVGITQPVAAEVASETVASPVEGSAEGDVTPAVVPVEQVDVESMVKVGRDPWTRSFVGPRKWRTVGIAVCLLGVVGAGWVVWGKLMPQEAADSPETKVEKEAGAVAVVVIPPPKGVVLQRVKAQFTKVGEGVVLGVHGTMKNTSETAIDLPPLRVELLGKDGKVQDMWPVNLASTTLLPAVEMPWGVSFTNPDVKNIAGWRAVFVK